MLLVLLGMFYDFITFSIGLFYFLPCLSGVFVVTVISDFHSYTINLQDFVLSGRAKELEKVIL